MRNNRQELRRPAIQPFRITLTDREILEDLQYPVKPKAAVTGAGSQAAGK